MSKSAEILVAGELAAGGERLSEEQELALEAVAQSLRQPLIDQINWCALLTTDRQHSLHAKHLELVAKINGTANDLLGQVQDLLDEEKIRGRTQAAEHPCTGADTDGNSAQESGATSAAGPAAQSPPEPAAQAVAVEVAAPSDGTTGPCAARRSRAKVLVVEESPTLRELLVGSLRPMFHVLVASDGWEALQLMVDRPDAIVADVNLAQVDFLDMVDQARRIAADVAVLAMHGVDDAALLAAARQRGVSEFLQKPFATAAVFERVEALAGQRQPQANKAILVACSDPHEGRALYHLLDARYCTVLACSLEVARGAAQDSFDVLITDTADAWWQEAVALCRGRNDGIRVLALGDGTNGDATAALSQLGVDAALPRPYSCDDLLAKMRHLLGIQEIDGSILRGVFRRGIL